MAQINHDIDIPNSGNGDELRTAFGNQNTMNTELYTTKVDKVVGKELSSNDYTNEEKIKLAGIEEGAQVNVPINWDDIVDRPDQLFASVGYFHHNDLATQTTPINVPADTDTTLTNDALGAQTNLTGAPYGVTNVFDSSTNAFDFSQLSIGDTIDLRVDLLLTTTSANQTYNVFLRIGDGGAETYDLPVFNGKFKNIETFERVAGSIGFSLDYESHITNPAYLYIISDDDASIKVNGWYTRILRKSINVIDLTGIDTFIELTDTPSNYTGQAGKAVVVNDDEDALEFVDFPESSNDLYKSWFSYTARNDLPGIFSVNNQALVATGTQTLVNSDGSTRILSIPLQNYVGATTAGALAGLKQANTGDCYMRQGYDAYFIFANNDTNSNHQTIVGFTSLLPNFPNVDISAYTGDFQGVGNDVGDANLSFYCKRITSTASYVKVPLGSGFPAHTTTDVYLLRLEAPQTEVAADQYIKMTITNLITGATATHTFTHLECPALSRPLCTSAQRSNRNTGASAVFRFGKVHVTRKIY